MNLGNNPKMGYDKAHRNGLIGHFGIAKTLDVLHEYFFHLKLKGMCKESDINALHVDKLSLKSYHMICILLYSYLKFLRLIFLWI
jgi:hypothetical protein